MKLRCETNSLRIRIRKSELTELSEDGKLIESVQFPDGKKFTYNLVIHDESDYVARFEDGNIWVQLPEEEARTWLESEQVSLSAELELTHSDTTLSILVEKDFPCKDRPDETGDDYFAELADSEGATC